eukprot:TRINITY_DN61471_c0_g1_i1.p2 TRINITY_DN61471_c0_g1~~TRINITY_DN61471_c0_g1_i1.p2  ORF type:complete len:107 (+),score=15.69 TRINITY_DN61471_c0_g1_i1:63-383(+)
MMLRYVVFGNNADGGPHESREKRKRRHESMAEAIGLPWPPSTLLKKRKLGRPSFLQCWHEALEKAIYENAMPESLFIDEYDEAWEQCVGDLPREETASVAVEMGPG